MFRFSRSFLMLAVASAVLTGCPPAAPPPTCDGGICPDATDAGGVSHVLPRPSRSTAINLTTNDAVVAAVNPDNDSLSLFNAVAKTKSTEVTFAPGSMPVGVVIHPDDLTAFVVLRKAGKLAKVTGLDKLTPGSGGEVQVGSEPTGVALSPTGAIAVVANFGDTTVTLVDTATMTALATVDVGGNPRAVAVTNDGDGDDEDEKAYVTLFYGAPVSEATDDGRIGKVVEVDLGARLKTATFDLAPIADTGFGVPQADGGVGASVGCSPNQLFNIALNNGKAYITHVCAAPKGPVFKFTNVFAGLSVIDLAARAEDRGPTGSVALSKLVAAQGGATAALLGVPIELDFKLGTNVAYVVAQAADKVQRVHFKGSDVRGPIVLGPDSNFAQMDLKGTGGIKVPLGIVVAHTKAQAFVNNWVDRSVQVLDLGLQTADGEPLPSASKPAVTTQEARELAGKKFFFTGTGRWADRGVSSCGSCHPDGLSDNLTWVFAAGPRQTTPLDGTFSKLNPDDQRALNWTAIFDELHDFELNTRGTSGGKGAITTAPDDLPFPLGVGKVLNGRTVATRNDNLSGSTKDVVTSNALLKDWDDIEAYVKKVHANTAPRAQDSAAVARGRAVFQAANCHTCHGGAKWTVSRVPYRPSVEKNGSLPGDDNVPAAASGLRTELRTGGVLPFPNPNINTDTRKVDVERIAGAGPGGAELVVAPERITCVLRAVGTFDAANAIEKKANGAQAQGFKGFNPPSLLGLATSAPYLHHGAAKTLEELFSGKFANHHQAGNALFLANGGTTAQEKAEVADLIAFLKAIDERTELFAIPANQDICGGY